jgi:DNA modification methylase
MPFQEINKKGVNKMFIYPELDNINRSLVLGNNLHIMEQLIEKGYSGKFDMIYFDGPFNSGLIFSMLNDRGIEFVHPWDETSSVRNHFHPNLYLEDYKERIKLAKELLSDTGIFVLQTNQIMSHYVKILLDEVFIKENFLREVIWKHSETPWSQDIDQFGYQHESLFFYSKTDNYYKIKDMTYPSVWDDIGGYDLGEENTNFPSQKPQKLLERIVEATTKEGDLVGDFYSGSGTLPYVAEKTNRRWFACDNHPNSMQIIKERFFSMNIKLTFHSIVEDFNPNYLDSSIYTKKIQIPFSLHELQTMKKVVGDEAITINAYSYFADVDLMEHDQFQFNLIMPASMENGVLEKSEQTISRPVPIQTKDGYSLKVENPVEWIFYHVVHVERDKFSMIEVNKETNTYLVDKESLVNQVEEMKESINDNWIQTVEQEDNFVKFVDIFGYSYLLNTKGS